MIAINQNISFEKVIINKLSAIILESSKSMFDAMEHTIIDDSNLQKEIKNQLIKYDLFKIKDKLEAADIQNICLLASYLYYLKSVYQNLNEPAVFDEFSFTDDYIPILKKNIKEIKQLKLPELKVEIFGSVYNTLFTNYEQNEKGQHFTNTDEIDIINAFCIKTNTDKLIDTACGAGAFLVRAFELLKYLYPEINQDKLIDRIWGIDIAPFPVFLTKVNLAINSPNFIQEDFTEFSDGSKLKLPQFDACIGNPPYIRQELIKNKKIWNKLIQEEFGIKKINKQSDLYVYYLMHTASFLKEGGRLGYVIASSWLDVSYGKDLQKFLLDHFKIIAIIDQQNTRSFETASVNTVILIAEKCSVQKERENNQVKFVRIYNEYSKIIGQITDKDRFDKLNDFVQSIENTNTSIKTENYYLNIVDQKELEKQSTQNGKYQNGHWGTKYFRVPEIYNEIIQKSKDKLIPLKEICEIKYGIKTGANDFFYLTDETERAIDFRSKLRDYWKIYGWYYSNLDKKHHLFERKYLKPILKSQREMNGLIIKNEQLKQFVLDIKNQKHKLKELSSELYNYIKTGESPDYKIDQRATCKGRISKNGDSDWYNLGKEIVIGDFIIPSKIGERFRLLDNRKSGVYCDKVSYNICIKPEYIEYSDILFAILNCTFFRYSLDLFSRQLTGSQTLSDVDVNVVQDTLIPHPKYLLDNESALTTIMQSMCKRKQESIFTEMEFEDRKQLDFSILSSIGLHHQEIDLLREKAIEFVQNRKLKSESIKTIKRPPKN
jgi:type I restriction-modification system DNA methylase subunit